MFYDYQESRVVVTSKLKEVAVQRDYFDAQMKLAEAERVGLWIYKIADGLPEGAEISIGISTEMAHGDNGEYFPSQSVTVEREDELPEDEDSDVSVHEEEIETMVEECFASDLYTLTDDWEIDFNVSRSLLGLCPKKPDGFLIYRTLFPASAESLERIFNAAKDALSGAEKPPATNA